MITLEGHRNMLESSQSATTEQRNCVQLFGLTVQSELPLPGPPPAHHAVADVEIVYGTVPERLPDASVSGIRYQARPGELLLKVDGVARYLSSQGRHITIEPAAGADEEDVRVFLLGSMLGALLHQRSVLVLHGSAIVANGSAVAFLGASGIGKSTLAMAFSRRGFPVLTDDLCVLWPNEASGLLCVHPGPPHAKLWEDSLGRMNIPAADLRRVRNKVNKRMLPLGADAALAPAPLAHVYVLTADNQHLLTLQPLSGPKKFNCLKGQTYRLRFLEGSGGKAAHFRHVLQLSRQASVTVALRPREGFRLDELTDLIAADLRL